MPTSLEVFRCEQESLYSLKASKDLKNGKGLKYKVSYFLCYTKKKLDTPFIPKQIFRESGLLRVNVHKMGNYLTCQGAAKNSR